MSLPSLFSLFSSRPSLSTSTSSAAVLQNAPTTSLTPVYTRSFSSSNAIGPTTSSTTILSPLPVLSTPISISTTLPSPSLASSSLSSSIAASSTSGRDSVCSPSPLLSPSSTSSSNAYRSFPITSPPPLASSYPSQCSSLSDAFCHTLDHNDVHTLLRLQSRVQDEFHSSLNTLESFNVMSDRAFDLVRKNFATHKKRIERIRDDLRNIFGRIRRLRQTVQPTHRFAQGEEDDDAVEFEEDADDKKEDDDEDEYYDASDHETNASSAASSSCENKEADSKRNPS
eukprot:TRINITY_DN5984_c0_g1_i1.p1 TRINITY_DN5984_c0_g1~~TRINITY_DN5984_c0_g1_i1.p1  ORF type:complete len:284 (-),score=65.83 TRINITY_DN5984_c0_g1_i1:334-1185(-)